MGPESEKKLIKIPEKRTRKKNKQMRSTDIIRKMLEEEGASPAEIAEIMIKMLAQGNGSKNTGI